MKHAQMPRPKTAPLTLAEVHEVIAPLCDELGDLESHCRLLSPLALVRPDLSPIAAYDLGRLMERMGQQLTGIRDSLEELAAITAGRQGKRHDRQVLVSHIYSPTTQKGR